MTDDRDTEADIPLEDLRQSVEGRADGEGAFIEQDVPDIDPEAVWAELEAEAPPDGPAEPSIRTIPKEVYCQRCEHFSRPPEIRCTYEGTTILDLVDPEHVRVKNCPVIARDEELGQIRESPRR